MYREGNVKNINTFCFQTKSHSPRKKKDFQSRIFTFLYIAQQGLETISRMWDQTHEELEKVYTFLEKCVPWNQFVHVYANMCTVTVKE